MRRMPPTPTFLLGATCRTCGWSFHAPPITGTKPRSFSPSCSRCAEEAMTPRQLLVLSLLLLLGAIVSAVVPEHPLFNQGAGKFVLGSMSAICAALALILWRRRPAPASDSGREPAERGR